MRLLLAVAAGLLWAPVAQGQTVAGRVLDESTDRPVDGAMVLLVDREGEGRARAESDSLGRFALRAPAPGDYTLVASRLGYERAQTPLLRIEGDALPRIDLLMRAQPIGLEGLEVRVDAAAVRRELRLFGVDTDLLPPARMVTREEILARQGSVDLAAVLQWQRIPGLTVRRTENIANPSAPVAPCVIVARARTGGGQDRCALYVVDGVPDPGGRLFWNLAETDVEAIVVLLPTEATTLFGTGGGGGVVLVLTRGWMR